MSNLSPERRAILQYLSKPEPYNSACGCVGEQRLDGKDYFANTHELRVTDLGADRVKVVKIIRDATNCDIETVQACLKGNGFLTKGSEMQVSDLKVLLQDTGVTMEVLHTKPQYFPKCPCAMKYVEEVDGFFYQISVNRSPDGITHEAFSIGPRGGPYKV